MSAGLTLMAILRLKEAQVMRIVATLQWLFDNQVEGLREDDPFEESSHDVWTEVQWLRTARLTPYLRMLARAPLAELKAAARRGAELERLSLPFSSPLDQKQSNHRAEIMKRRIADFICLSRTILRQPK
jgi:hypothetical protein